MGSRMVIFTKAGGNLGSVLGLKRWSHSITLTPPLAGAIHHGVTSRPFVFLEFDHNSDQVNFNDYNNNNNNNIGFDFRNFPFAGTMDLMAVPKRKVSPHKRGIRNGPKALKPIPVIIRCKSCGRVKLPHFFCCSGERVKPGEQTDATN